MTSLSVAAPPETETRARVRPVDPLADPRWDRFVAAHPDGLAHHCTAWLRVLREAFGHAPLGLVCESADGDLTGILPLAWVHGLLGGRRLSSLPHTPAAGPLALDARSARALVDGARQLAGAVPGARLQLKLAGAAAAGIETVPWSETYVLELPERVEQLRFGSSRNHQRVKWAVGKAERLGVELRTAEREADLAAWYDLYVETMRWHTTPPLPYRFFQVAWRRLRPAGLLRLLLAEQRCDGRARLLSGSVFLAGGQTVLYAYNGRRRDDLALRPNDLIQWRAIHDACRDGFRRYDFGEVAAPNQGLAEFKAKWGAEARWLSRYVDPPMGSAAGGALSLRPGTPARELLNRAWRRLPLDLTVALGRLLHRYVAVTR